MIEFDKDHSSTWIEMMSAYQVFRAKLFDWANEPDQVKQKDLLYFLGREEEYFIAWGIENAKGEQMTINLENELYEILKKDYLSALAVPAGKYAEVDEEWLKGKVKIEA